MAERGFTWCFYVDDNGSSWALKVDSQYAADADRGWVPIEDNPVPPLPRGWRPRVLIGLDEEGREQRAIAATLAAAIWTGLVSTFIFKANDGIDRVADIIGRLEEQRISPPGFP